VIAPHELHAGTPVFSRDGERLGELARVVLKRADLSLTHIVVDIGFLRSGRPPWLGGFGLEYDRLVPLEEVHAVSDRRIELRLDARDFMALPEYTIESFRPAWDLTPDEFDLPDVVNRAQALAAALGSTAANFWLMEALNKSPDEVDIREGTPVWRREPHSKLGEVHRLLLDPQTGRLRALVLKRGFIFKEEVILPVRHLAEIADDVVRVDISDEALSALRQYREG
jgi:uncharacterized protein YrrD